MLLPEGHAIRRGMLLLLQEWSLAALCVVCV